MVDDVVGPKQGLLRILPFGPVFEKMDQAGTAVTQAHIGVLRKTRHAD
jgi:hypothetical protein